MEIGCGKENELLSKASSVYWYWTTLEGASERDAEQGESARAPFFFVCIITRERRRAKERES